MAEDPTFRSSYIEGVSKFNSMRSRAFWEDVINLLRGQSSELISFDDVRTRLRLRAESYRGLMDIPLDKIRGSVGRYTDFTANFLPKSSDMRDRWSRVYAKVNSLEGVPPIDVYKVGDVYFVRDGNHRVSVARQIGAKTIQAHVTELPTSVTLTPDMTPDDLDAKAAYVQFLEETELNNTRPHHQSMELSEPTRYPELMGHIYLHAQVMEQAHGHAVSMAEAAADWYDNVFRPAVTLIRKYDVMEEVANRKKERTEADLYLWMVDHLREIRKLYGQEAERRRFSHALIDFLNEHKMPIPRELLDEKDDSVILSRSQMLDELRRAEKDDLKNSNSEE